MSERYTRIYTLAGYKFPEEIECPVSVEAGALLLDNEQKKVLAQIKYKNLTNKSIKSMTVDVKVYDKQQNQIKSVEGFEYKNLIAGAGDTFGEKSPVFMNDNNAASFYVNVNNIVYSDGSRWSKSGKEFANDAKKAAEISLELGEKAIEVGKEIGEKAIVVGKKGAKKLLPFILNCLASICFIALAFVGFNDLDGTPQGYIALAGTIISAIISLPGMGKLIFRKKYGLLQKILRWVIIVVILVVVLNINKFISM